jgi:type I restriction enzyme specificity protein hsdS
MNNATNTNMFPYLERLLDGEAVEWKTLGEVAEFKRGQTITQKTAQAGVYPVISGGQQPAYYIDQYNRTGQTITVAGSGAYAGFVMFWNEPIFVSDAFSIKANEEVLLPRYVFHFLLNKQNSIFNLKRGSGVPHVYAKDLAVFSIPIPPLRVQVRIVEILDKFTQLEAELEKELAAELEARKKQYVYYRDQLLNFSQYPPLNVNIEWKTLGEVMEIVTDFTAAGSFASNAQNVRYLQEPNYALLVRTTDIKQGFKSTEKFIYVDQHAFEYLWRVNLDKECIILPNVGNCGEVYHSSPTILPYKNCVLGPNAILVRSEKASNKFLYYLFQAEYFQKELAKITSNAGQGKFNKTNLKQIKLPVPPLSEQRRIVDILDRFDTLTNSISEGLPKEIALRRKQYAYYRDALLSFPRPEVSA